ncbi:MAG: amidase domain-containing protein [Clostridia bacterium]|nr:amidase domain-containing protein [Clostridia bacterium]
MSIKNYDRNNAVIYAKKWALVRNPNYYNFDKLGGDCTNFVSQCIFAGCNVMNYSKRNGWYYSSLNERSPSWTGVEFLFNFLTSNNSIGPFGKVTDMNSLQLGDVIQLGKSNGTFYHAVIITDILNGNIYTSSHTLDSINRPVSSYKFDRIRYIHIDGIRI